MPNSAWRLFAKLLFCAAMNGCSEKESTLGVGFHQFISETSSRAQWLLIDEQIAKNRKQFLTVIGEPDLKLETRESYRWVYGRPFDSRAFLFRIIVYESDSAELISKIAAGPGCFADSIFVQHKGAYFHLRGDSLLEEATQQLTPAQLDRINTLLRGSYYWALNDPYPNGSGFCDGDFLTLESMSMPIGADSLRYHTVGIHVPFDGTFKELATYVASISRIGEEAKVYLSH